MKTVFCIIIFLTFCHESYSSFPVTANTSIEFIDELNSEPILYSNNSKFGKISFILAAISLLTFILSIALESLIGLFLVTPLIGLIAFICGIKGCIKTQSNLLAIIGLILGFLEFGFLIISLLTI